MSELDDELSRVLGQRRDTLDNEKWSGRWESKMPLWRRKYLEIKVLRDLLNSACDFCVKNSATEAIASQHQPMRPLGDTPDGPAPIREENLSFL